jgi:hypothetical protein
MANNVSKMSADFSRFTSVGPETMCCVGPASIYPVTGAVQLMRRCRKHLVLLIPSPSGFFVAGLEGGGPRDEKSRWRRCISDAILEPEGDSERRLHLSASIENVSVVILAMVQIRR